MNRFISGQIFYLFPERNAFIDRWQRTHFIDELENHGVSFYCYNSLNENQESYEEKVLGILKNNPESFSMFMTAMNDDELSSTFLLDIKKLGIPTLLVCWDNLVIPYFHKRIAPFFDLVWLTSFETEHMFKRWGANTVFLPYASNPYVFKPAIKKSVNKLLFIGSPHGGRRRMVQMLSSNAIETNVFGRWTNEESSGLSIPNIDVQKKIKKLNNYIRFYYGRKCLKSSLIHAVKQKLSDEHNPGSVSRNPNLIINGPLSFDEMVSAYSNYALSLSIIEYLDTFLLKDPIYKLHLRTFEIPMSGGLQITKRIPEIEDYYQDGEDIVLYDSEEELVDKSRYYLKVKNSDKVLKMKLQARIKSEHEHTWKKRFECIHDKLFQ